MRAKVISSSLSALILGKEYEILARTKRGYKVRNENGKLQEYHPRHFDTGKQLKSFILSVEGRIFINAAHRRELLADWAFLRRGDKAIADKLTLLAVRKDVSGLIEMVGRANMDDLDYWIRVMQRKELINPKADKKYIKSIIKNTER